MKRLILERYFNDSEDLGIRLCLIILALFVGSKAIDGEGTLIGVQIVVSYTLMNIACVKRTVYLSDSLSEQMVPKQSFKQIFMSALAVSVIESLIYGIIALVMGCVWMVPLFFAISLSKTVVDQRYNTTTNFESIFNEFLEFVFILLFGLILTLIFQIQTGLELFSIEWAVVCLLILYVIGKTCIRLNRKNTLAEYSITYKGDV